jgi:hypothetical protein
MTFEELKFKFNQIVEQFIYKGNVENNSTISWKVDLTIGCDTNS